MHKQTNPGENITSLAEVIIKQITNRKDERNKGEKYFSLHAQATKPLET